MSDFWARKIGGISAPRPAQPASPGTGAWWQAPGQYAPEQPMFAQPQQAGQTYPYNPALQAQMPHAGQLQRGERDQYIRDLRKVRNAADQLTQEQMEEIAEWELQHDAKYNASCPQCGSANFAPQGTKLHNTKLGSDKCFDCGASSSTYASSPEPAAGGSGASKARRLDIRQIDTGGAVQSMYMKFDGIPANYIPRI